MLCLPSSPRQPPQGPRRRQRQAQGRGADGGHQAGYRGRGASHGAREGRHPGGALLVCDTHAVPPTPGMWLAIPRYPTMVPTGQLCPIRRTSLRWEERETLWSDYGVPVVDSPRQVSRGKLHRGLLFQDDGSFGSRKQGDGSGRGESSGSRHGNDVASTKRQYRRKTNKAGPCRGGSRGVWVHAAL